MTDTIDHQQAAVPDEAIEAASAAYMATPRCRCIQTPQDKKQMRAALEAALPHLPSGDKYHTLDELYEYRMLYNAHAANGWHQTGIPVVKSRRHHDGEECFGGGWFIVTAQLPTGQVSNHYPDADWDLFAVPEVECAPEWDGHTPQVSALRLRQMLEGSV